ncbi:methyltransferase [Psychrobacter piechaudii]|uniref:N5-glutamine S-adenosyl-L-methionine-dependent methyltransferase n=1 Tax=Psychrobacter piechaudii TaxID=1945521 RepID=A0A1R4GRD3_9GAMM|nr:class I SAM-dependent methyltransferase [Psychrobacter piechaudii]SJM70727.1 N5-glutamine S-adenosyl-L-methionine-dependent methyltransferase [Psychrobacter piechaudii]
MLKYKGKSVFIKSSQYLQWEEGSTEHKARWLSQSNHAPPKRIVIIDDTITADEAYRLANAGTSMLWRGDYHNAKQLIQALQRRIDRAEQRKIEKAEKKAVQDAHSSKSSSGSQDLPQLFHKNRLAQSQRSRLLGRLLLSFDANYQLNLRRAPEVSEACEAAFGDMNEACVMSFRDLQGALGAAQWRKKGVPVKALSISVHPHYGVFAPTRQEYVQLLLDAPLPDSCKVAYDIGTGTGLLAIVLAKRGFKQIIATDLNPHALECAQDNFDRLGLSNVQLQQVDLFPTDAPPANLIVCNPPWLPAKPSSPLEYSVYDANSAMLRGLLMGAKQHLADEGEVWLILSDLAEHLKLRTREELIGWIEDAGLKVKYRLDTEPMHGKSQDESDPLFAARSAEVTSLWCLC